MSEPGAQRSYRAPCPGCGAPVEFRSAQSAFAVCPYCQSTVVRQGETLARIGKMAELFDDFSPLQLFAGGRIQNKPFTLIGRLQYSYPGGHWTEWVAMLDGDPAATGAAAGDRIGFLSEDNGAFVFSLPFDLGRLAPPAGELRIGASTAFNAQNYTVASSELVTLVSAQGELSHLPGLGRPVTVVELRNDKGLVLSLDYSQQPPSATLGGAVQLEDLQLTGLRDESARVEKGRSFQCPNCGASVTLHFAESKTITCGSCHSIIDVSQGIGGEIRHAEQGEPVRPLIALGSLGQLQGVSWQVVGFQHRMGQEPDADVEDGQDSEHVGWSEYLLYNATRGFCFLVDAEDGWSVVKPATGAPSLTKGSNSASYLGKAYRQLYAYNAETTYVAGEFYWKVERGQRTFNRDFANGASLLSMERAATEITWSTGSRLGSAAVAAAFGLDAKKDLFKRADASPLSASSGTGLGASVLMILIIVAVVIMLDRCTGPFSGTRSSGASYGGYSSGGGHK